MTSINAINTAHEVINTVRKGKKVNMQIIQKNNGYSKLSAHSMKAIDTKSYKDTIKPFLQKMIDERERIMTAMSKRDLTHEQYRTLSDAMTKMSHDIQLLSGKATEHIATNVVIYGSDDFLSLQMKSDDKQ